MSARTNISRRSRPRAVARMPFVTGYGKCPFANPYLQPGLARAIPSLPWAEALAAAFARPRGCRDFEPVAADVALPIIGHFSHPPTSLLASGPWIGGYRPRLALKVAPGRSVDRPGAVTCLKRPAHTLVGTTMDPV